MPSLNHGRVVREVQVAHLQELAGEQVDSELTAHHGGIWMKYCVSSAVNMGIMRILARIGMYQGIGVALIARMAKRRSFDISFGPLIFAMYM